MVAWAPDPPVRWSRGHLTHRPVFAWAPYPRSGRLRGARLGLEQHHLEGAGVARPRRAGSAARPSSARARRAARCRPCRGLPAAPVFRGVALRALERVLELGELRLSGLGAPLECLEPGALRERGELGDLPLARESSAVTRASSASCARPRRAGARSRRARPRLSARSASRSASSVRMRAGAPFSSSRSSPARRFSLSCFLRSSEISSPRARSSARAARAASASPRAPGCARRAQPHRRRGLPRKLGRA